MILLDTDHLSILADGRHALRLGLLGKLRFVKDQVAIPIVSVEEQLRGWLAAIRGRPDVHQQIVPYLRLAKHIDFLQNWQVIDWNEPAADEFVRLRKQRVRIGTQDLKIASLALANDATLLSANLKDFEQVPSLQVENWLR